MQYRLHFLQNIKEKLSIPWVRLMNVVYQIPKVAVQYIRLGYFQNSWHWQLLLLFCQSFATFLIFYFFYILCIVSLAVFLFVVHSSRHIKSFFPFLWFEKYYPVSCVHHCHFLLIIHCLIFVIFLEWTHVIFVFFKRYNIDGSNRSIYFFVLFALILLMKHFVLNDSVFYDIMLSK